MRTLFIIFLFAMNLTLFSLYIPSNAYSDQLFDAFDALDAQGKNYRLQKSYPVITDTTLQPQWPLRTFIAMDFQGPHARTEAHATLLPGGPIEILIAPNIAYHLRVLFTVQDNNVTPELQWTPIYNDKRNYRIIVDECTLKLDKAQFTSGQILNGEIRLTFFLVYYDDKQNQLKSHNLLLLAPFQPSSALKILTQELMHPLQAILRL